MSSSAGNRCRCRWRRASIRAPARCGRAGTAARLRRERQGLRGHAGRADAGGRRHGPPCAVARARRRQQRHVRFFPISPSSNSACSRSGRRTRRLHRGGRDLPSRTADALFWLGRYTERAECAVRLLRSLVIRLGGEMGSTRTLVSPERRRGDADRPETSIGAPRPARHAGGARGRAARALDDPVRCRVQGRARDRVGNVQRNAEAVRERLSFDTFQDPARPHRRHPVVGAFAEPRGGRCAASLESPHSILAAFNGMVAENMTHGYGWRFLDMGRRLERTRSMIQMIQQLAVRGDAQAGGELELLLELADEHDDLSRALSSRAAACRRARPLAV